jgi:hypothetical protein
MRDNIFGITARTISGTRTAAMGTFATSATQISPGVITGASVTPTSMPSGDLRPEVARLPFVFMSCHLP